MIMSKLPESPYERCDKPQKESMLVILLFITHIITSLYVINQYRRVYVDRVQYSDFL